MIPSSATTAPRSLATIAPGDTVEIRCILFDAVRDHCAGAGLRPGDRVHCRGSTAARLLLERDDGRLTHLERRWAQFVEAVPAPPPAWRLPRSA